MFWSEYTRSPADNASERQAEAELGSFPKKLPLLLSAPSTTPNLLWGLDWGWGSDISQTMFCCWTQDTSRQRTGTDSSLTTRFMNYSAWEASALRKGKGRDKENVQKVHKDKCL